LGSSLPPTELARRDSGIFEKMICLFSFTPKVGRSGEVTRVFLTEKHSTNAGRGSDRRWRRVCRLTLEDGLRRRGVKRAGVCATDADVSVCRSCAAEAAKAWQQQTLSRVCRPREGKVLSVPRLSRRQTRALDTSDASDARPGDASIALARCRPLWTASVGPGGMSVAQRRTCLSHGGEAQLRLVHWRSTARI
jgi:hypothetical protein